MIQPWYQRAPSQISLEEANDILSEPTSKQLFPNQFNDLLIHIQSQVAELKEKSKADNPLAWFQPSYEQHLKLEAWLYGYDYIVDFDANRIGKTAGGVINCLLWTLPNDPAWLAFQPFTDHLSRTYHCTPRPSVSAIRLIKNNLRYLNLNADPKLPKGHPTNQAAYEATILFIRLNEHTFPPNPPIRTIWQCGPSHDWNKANVMKEWAKWTPKAVVKESFSDYKHQMILEHANLGNKVHPVSIITIDVKSYDTETEKWGGGAVDGICCSEGIPPPIFSEIKQRFKYPAFASWDYTPYEPTNTGGKSALAHKVYNGKEPLPLTPTIFSGFGIENTPEYIMDKDKREDLLRAWKGKKEGDARIKGIFYTSSPVVLTHYDPEIHALHISFEQLKKMYAPKPLILFRGVDPGWSHICACAFMALAPDGKRFIFRFYAQSQRSIAERCEDIIKLSGNERVLDPRTSSSVEPAWIERVTKPENKYHITWIDYHSFKTDEQTKRPYALNYTKNGLVVRASVTFGPKERAGMLNDLLQPRIDLPHPITKKPPGGKLYFLINEPGVAEAVEKMSEILWLTYEQGDKKGLTKDTIQDYDDDELDAACYVAIPEMHYKSFSTSQNDSSTTGGTPSISFNSGIVFTS